MLPASNPHSQSIRLGDHDYLLVPLGDGNTLPHHGRGYRSELQRFDSESLKKVKQYEYKRLPGGKKRIRLVQLMSGETQGLDIFCEFIEADFDQTFHVPVRVGGESQANGSETKRANLEILQQYQDQGYEEEIPRGQQRETHERGKREELNRARHEVRQRTSAEKQKLETQAIAELKNHWNDVQQTKIEYEALSWCWGMDEPKFAVKIIENGKTYKIKVRRDLALALKYLRLPDETRTLWIDAICIDQDDSEERNHQVQMMSRIYTRAKQVCVWLGEDTPDSKVAINFIREEITELKDFDTICSDKMYTHKWQALMMLMQAPWFSRRWVVQEIALARQATVYCGKDWIPWKEFAVAVELFVEVETVTHRLSEIMRKDEKFRHVPGWFEYVSELGASLLVNATGKVFRTQRAPMYDDHGKEESKVELEQRLRKVRTIDPLERRSLLSLEYLVSTMFIFKATEPRDVIYSLLAIARDAAPFVGTTYDEDDASALTMTLFDGFLEEKPFLIDYSRPYSDVCRDFVRFTIRCKSKLDAAQALDILCRPWALEPSKKKSIRYHSKQDENSETIYKKQRLFPVRSDKWTIRNSNIEVHTINGKLRWRIVKSDEDSRHPDYRTTAVYIKEITEKKEWDPPKGSSLKWKRPSGWEKYEAWCIQYKEQTKADKFSKKEQYEKNRKGNEYGTKEEAEDEKDIELPSWVARASRAPFSLDNHLGMRFPKTGRANADPLVGQPSDGHRNYNAAQARRINLEVLKFRKRPSLGHYSMYVQGFELDEVVAVADASQGGDILISWLKLGGWEEGDNGYSTDPPEKLWRTLVADRGRDNRNPPYYYARACRESVHKGSISSGRVDTTALINNERNSIVAEFCRRVHAVIWNRRIVKTKSGRLGLAHSVGKGDKICIFYGCTVPVVLQKHVKLKPNYEKGEEGDVAREEFEDGKEALKMCIRQWEKNCERKVKNMHRNILNRKKWKGSGELNEMQDAKRYAERQLRRDTAQAEEKAKIDVEVGLQQRESENEGYRGESDEDYNSQQLETKGPTQQASKAPESERGNETPTNSSTDEHDAGQTLPFENKSNTTVVDETITDSESDPARIRRTKTSYRLKVEEAKIEDPFYCYNFQSECYLHGMMDGEAMREKFYQDIPDRIIELR